MSDMCKWLVGRGWASMGKGQSIMFSLLENIPGFHSLRISLDTTLASSASRRGHWQQL